MSKWAAREIMDAGLLLLKGRSNRLYLCPQEPDSFEEAERLRIGAGALDKGDIEGPGPSPRGRQVSVEPGRTITVERRGRITHVALADTRRRQLEWITRCEPLEVRRGDRLRVDDFRIGANQPS